MTTLKPGTLVRLDGQKMRYNPSSVAKPVYWIDIKDQIGMFIEYDYTYGDPKGGNILFGETLVHADTSACIILNEEEKS